MAREGCRMTKQEKHFIQLQIKRLKARKENLIDEFIGRCEEINNEIKEYRTMLKGSDKS